MEPRASSQAAVAIETSLSKVYRLLVTHFAQSNLRDVALSGSEGNQITATVKVEETYRLMVFYLSFTEAHAGTSSTNRCSCGGYEWHG